MEKMNKPENEMFVVRENFKGKRRVVTTSQTLSKILLSNLHGKVICASEKNKELDTTFQDFFTYDKCVIRGVLKVNYTVTDYIAYAKERNTESVLDTLARTILSQYFQTIKLENIHFPFQMPQEIKDDFVSILNYYLSEMMPWIKVTSIGDVKLSNSKRVENRFGYKFNSFINSKENEESYDAEYYEPIAAYKCDDIAAKQFYPSKRYVAKDQMLYYCGILRKPGTYHNKKAKGYIVNLGINVYSTTKKVIKREENGEVDNRLCIYPNVVFEVVNIKKFYSENEMAYRLFDELCEQIAKAVDYDPNTKNLCNDIFNIEAIDHKPIRELADKLRYYYGAKVRYVVFPLKNPCVRKQSIVKDQNEILKNLFNESTARCQRKK